MTVTPSPTPTPAPPTPTPTLLPPSREPVADASPRDVGRLFGTDGIRGIANVDLRPPLAYALGRAVAHELAAAARRRGRRPGHPPIGRDAGGRDRRRRREHGQPTSRSPGSCRRRPSPSSPGRGGFAGGVMVSASHNPADDNGLKVLDSRGLKLDEPRRGRAGAADLARRGARWARGTPGSAASSTSPASWTATASTAGSLARATPCDLHIVLDCANGAAAPPRPRSWPRPGRRVDVIHNEPDGVNINAGCGATAPGLARRRGRGRAARTSASPSTVTPTASSSSTVTGEVVDGDQLLGVCALDRLAARRAAGRHPRRDRAVATAASRPPCQPPAGSSSGRPSATSTSSRGCR